MPIFKHRDESKYLSMAFKNIKEENKINFTKAQTFILNLGNSQLYLFLENIIHH